MFKLFGMEKNEQEEIHINNEQQLKRLIDKEGKEQAFLLLAKRRNYRFLEEMIREYGKEITHFYGTVEQKHGLVTQGNALTIAIIGNPFDPTQRFDNALFNTIQLLIKNDCPVNDVRLNKSPLHFILINSAGRMLSVHEKEILLSSVDTLLRAGADPYAFEADGDEMPLDSVKNEDVKILIKELYKQYHPAYKEEEVARLKKIQIRKNNFKSAVLENQPDKLKELLQEEIDVNMPLQLKNESYSPLAMAIILNYEEIALQLINAGADVHYKRVDKKGNQSGLLVLTLLNSNPVIIEKLLEQGANPNEPLCDQSDLYSAALQLKLWHYFALTGHKDIVEIFLKRCANLEMETSSGFSILELLEPKTPLIKNIYKDCQVQMKKCALGDEQQKTIQLMIDYVKAVKKGMQDEQDGIEGGIKNAKKLFIENSLELDSSKENRKLLKDLKNMNDNTLMIQGNQWVSVISLRKTLTDLFAGGNEVHREILHLIDASLNNTQELSLNFRM